MLLDLIALAIFGFFILLGAWRGSLATGAGLVSLAFSYAAAAAAAGALGDVVALRTGVPEMFGPVLAGTLAFVVSYLSCAVVTAVLKVWERKRRGVFPRGISDRLGGAAFGALRGGLIVLLLSMLVTWLDAARDLGVLSGLDAVPDAGESRVSRAAGAVLESAVETALASAGDAPSARVMARLAAQPGTTLENVQRLLEDDRLQQLQDDKFFWVLVEHGAGERAINQSSFYNMVHDPELRERMADLGLVDEAAASDPAAFREAMSGMLTKLGPLLKSLREDPEIAQLARDPEIVAMLQSGDTFSLLTHPGIQRVVSRVAANQ